MMMDANKLRAMGLTADLIALLVELQKVATRIPARGERGIGISDIQWDHATGVLKIYAQDGSIYSTGDIRTYLDEEDRAAVQEAINGLSGKADLALVEEINPGAFKPFSTPSDDWNAISISGLYRTPGNETAIGNPFGNEATVQHNEGSLGRAWQPFHTIAIKDQVGGRINYLSIEALLKPGHDLRIQRICARSGHELFMELGRQPKCDAGPSVLFCHDSPIAPFQCHANFI